MRTLILLAVLAVSQIASAQPLFIDSEPMIEFVQNSDGTWKKLYIIEAAAIAQPEDVKFTKEEMTLMMKGVEISREQTLESTTKFSLRKFPFFSVDQLILKKSFSLNEGGNVEVLRTSENREKLPTTGIFWLVAICLAVVFGLGISPPHKSWLSLLIVGTSMISTIVASYYFGWWGFGTGLVAVYASILWNQKGGYYSSFFFDLLGRPVSTTVVFGLGCITFAERWEDVASQMLFGATMATIVAIAFGMSALYLRWQDRRLAKETEGRHKNSGEARTRGIIRY